MMNDEILSYAGALKFLYSLQLFGANFGLERVRKLAELSGNPQEKLRFIHVAGTNGKGSTCAMLESIYRAAGLRVGLFTSPHLVSFRERIQLNRQLISEKELIQLVRKIQPWLKEFSAENHPTMFEVVAVMALVFFAEQKCDLVIWETGLGGRLDATNIVTPIASIITNIAFDHTQWLGDTLGKIAAEKAGIIKPGVPIITAEDKLEALNVLEETARRNNALLVQIAEPSTFNLQPLTSLIGEHQKQNAALALATIEVLQKQIPITPKQIQTGLKKVYWPGRLQLIERGAQKILLDGAHNLAGIETLCAALKKDASTFSAVTLIVGLLGDKDWRPMCQLLAPLAAEIFTVPVSSERTADAHELAKVFRAANPAAKTVVLKNLLAAINASKDRPFVVIAGSLYLIGEALELLGDASESASERGLNEWTAKK